MRNVLGLLLLVAILCAACGNSIDPVANPTPTPGATPDDPTGTYSVTASQPLQQCNAPTGTVSLTFTAPSVYIEVNGSDFTPDWSFQVGPTLSLPDPEHGTLSGSDFTVNYTYCDYDGLANFTTKHVTTWTGSFNADGSFDSTLNQVLRNEVGNVVATCGAGELDPSVTTDMMQCTNPGVTWSLHGVKQ